MNNFIKGFALGWIISWICSILFFIISSINTPPSVWECAEGLYVKGKFVCTSMIKVE